MFMFASIFDFHVHDLIETLGIIVVGAPALLAVLLGVPSLLGRPLAEASIDRLVRTSIVTGLLAALAMLGLMLSRGAHHVSVDLGTWAHIPDYHFSVKLIFDRLSIPFVILTFLLSGTIGAFATKYMHREKGFNRFFALYAIFVLGMVITSLAGTIETLFSGWELVGLTSALLVAFYHERPAPPRNGLRIWCVYRVSDAALLIAAVVMHRMIGEGDFDRMVGGGFWPQGEALMTSRQALVVGLLLLVAAAGKSALVPFSGWLPRAMEGPTPSSAVFYGALSVHLGAFLLLRVSPILDLSPWLGAAVVVMGLATASFAAYAGSAQADIKSALSFASLTQVGLIVAEIGIGLRYLALVHILGHACLRTLQFVRAPSLLLDYRVMENALGERLPRKAGLLGRWIPEAQRDRFYRLAVERGFLDVILVEYLARPAIEFFQACDRFEWAWTNFLSGGESRVMEATDVSLEPLDDL